MITRLAQRLWNNAPLLLSLTSLFWAGNIVLGRAVADIIPPITLAWVRWTGAFLILLPFTYRAMIENKALIKKHWRILSVLSLTGITAYNTMAYIGLSQTKAINALLMQSSGPLLIAGWGYLLFQEKLSKTQTAAILLSLLGVLLIITKADISMWHNITWNTGDVWFLSALLIYALYTACLRKRPAMPSMPFLAVVIGYGALFLTPLWVAEMSTKPFPDLTANVVTAMAYVVVFPSVLAYLCFNRGVELVGANRAAPYFHLMPVFGSLIAVLGLGEDFETYHILGYALVLTGITLSHKTALNDDRSRLEQA